MTRLTHSIQFYLCILILIMVTHVACQSGCNVPSRENPVLFIPILDSIIIDGDSGDWPVSPSPLRIFSDVCGNVPAASDLSVSFRLGWDPGGLLILVDVQDDSIVEDPERFWNGDGIEMFISPRSGSFDIVQYSVRPSFDQPDSAVRVKTYDHRRTLTGLSVSPTSLFHSKKLPDGYRLEGRIPLEVIGLDEPLSGLELAVQMYVHDADMETDSMNQSLPWYPVRDSYRNPYAFFTVRFMHSVPDAPKYEIRACVRDDKYLRIKILSEYGNEKDKMQLICGDFHTQFKLNPVEDGLCMKQLDYPLRKFDSDENLQFLLKDSLIFSIHPCLLYRIYQDIPEPGRYEDEIRIFEIVDHFQPPPDSVILFTGSSTIRRWYDMEYFLPGITLLNRGFGGSTMMDLNLYADRIVFPYKPSRIFVYEGDNDIAGGTDPAEFIEECTTFIHNCAEHVPEADLFFISIKPSLARIKNWEEMQDANRMLSDLANRYEKVHFIDVSEFMLNADGRPRNDIFVEDGLHLNVKGYGILAEAIKPFIYK